MHTKYDLMNSGVVTDSNGNPYPDLASFPIETFSPSVTYRNYNLTDNDIYRFDVLINSIYGEFAFYDDFTLWISDIPFLSDDTNFEAPIKLFSKADIDTWFLSQVK